MSEDIFDKNDIQSSDKEAHSDYKPVDQGDETVKHQLSGMYQNWFLDYASYVILERAVPHINDGLKPVQRRILQLYEAPGRRTLQQGGKYRRTYHASSILMVMRPSAMHWYSWDRKICLSTVRELGKYSYR